MSFAPFSDRRESKQAQDARVAHEFAFAFARARQWAVASGEAAPSGREIATFVDNQVFSGGALDGVWYPQAKAFRELFEDDGQMVAFVAAWLRSCPSSGPDLLYGAKEGVADADLWSRKVPPGARLSDDQGLLFSLGFLRGLAADGPSAKPADSGIFKAQVFIRRGMIALGVGTANGVAWPGGALN